MPWSSEPGGGFTTGTPWLPMGPASWGLDVAAEGKDPESSLSLYQHLIHLRRQSPALIEGDYRSVPVNDENVFMFVRETEKQRFLIVLNFSKLKQSVDLRGQAGKWVAGTHLVQGDGEPAGPGELALAPYEGRVYEMIQGEA